MIFCELMRCADPRVRDVLFFLNVKSMSLNGDFTTYVFYINIWREKFRADPLRKIGRAKGVQIVNYVEYMQDYMQNYMWYYVVL